MQTPKISPLSGASLALSRPARLAPRASRTPLQVRAHSQAEIPLPAQPLAGCEWSSGIANWVRHYSTDDTWDTRTRLQFAPEGLTKWMFRELTHELPPFGEHALRAYPAYVLAALLAPMAGLHPEQREEQINDAVLLTGGQAHSPWLNRGAVIRLLRNLFGQDMRAHPPGEHPLPADVEGLRFWAALRGNGELWVSDARWGATGAFLIEYPHVSPGLNPMDCLCGKMIVSWDANLERFYDPDDMPIVLTWAAPADDSVIAPWAISPRHNAQSMLDLVTSISFEPVHLLPSTVPRSATINWPSEVHISMVDPVARRVMGSVNEESELLCHTEAWIAGLRYEALHRQTHEADTRIDAASLLSALSASVNQCPIELRLVELLCFAQARKISWAGLPNLPEGEWLNGVMEDLVGAGLRGSHLTFSSANSQIPEGLLRNHSAAHGTLQTWLTAHEVGGQAKPFSERGILNVHLSGPLFGDTPATLCRSYSFDPEFVAQNMRVVLGEAVPPPPNPLSKRLLFHFLSQDTNEETRGLSHRATSHREFWNALLDFNEPSGI